MEKVTVEVLGEGFIDPGYHRLTQFIGNDLDKFRTGPRTSPTVSRTINSPAGQGYLSFITPGLRFLDTVLDLWHEETL